MRPGLATEPACSDVGLCEPLMNPASSEPGACTSHVTVSANSDLADAAEKPKVEVWPDGRFAVVYQCPGQLYFRTFSSLMSPGGDAAVWPSPGYDTALQYLAAIPDLGFLVDAYGSHGDVAQGGVEVFALARYSDKGGLLQSGTVLSYVLTPPKPASA